VKKKTGRKNAWSWKLKTISPLPGGGGEIIYKRGGLCIATGGDGNGNWALRSKKFYEDQSVEAPQTALKKGARGAMEKAY